MLLPNYVLKITKFNTRRNNMTKNKQSLYDKIEANIKMWLKEGRKRGETLKLINIELRPIDPSLKEAKMSEGYGI